MRIIFLDVDGVLNHYGTWEEPAWSDGTIQEGTMMLDPRCVSEFHRARDHLGLTIVLSSTWRTDDDHVAYLRKRGIFGPDDAYLHLDWRTPVRWGSRLRGHEIADWLEAHPEIGPTDYAIVDDDGDMLPGQYNRFIQTSFKIGGGFNTHHAAQLAALPWRPVMGQSAT